MKYCYFLLFIFFFTSFHSQTQNCNLYIEYDSSNFAVNKDIGFNIKNIGSNKIKIPEKINPVFITVEDMEILNTHNNNYDKVKFNIVDVDCFNRDCYGKMVILKSKGQKKYIISLMNKFSFKEKGLYRFKVKLNLSFNFCNDFITDWIYYEIK